MYAYKRLHCSPPSPLLPYFFCYCTSTSSPCSASLHVLRRASSRHCPRHSVRGCYRWSRTIAPRRSTSMDGMRRRTSPSASSVARSPRALFCVLHQCQAPGHCQRPPLPESHQAPLHVERRHVRGGLLSIHPPTESFDLASHATFDILTMAKESSPLPRLFRRMTPSTHYTPAPCRRGDGVLPPALHMRQVGVVVRARNGASDEIHPGRGQVRVGAGDGVGVRRLHANSISPYQVLPPSDLPRSTSICTEHH